MELALWDLRVRNLFNCELNSDAGRRQTELKWGPLDVIDNHRQNDRRFPRRHIHRPFAPRLMQPNRRNYPAKSLRQLGRQSRDRIGRDLQMKANLRRGGGHAIGAERRRHQSHRQNMPRSLHGHIRNAVSAPHPGSSSRSINDTSANRCGLLDIIQRYYLAGSTAIAFGFPVPSPHVPMGGGLG